MYAAIALQILFLSGLFYRAYQLEIAYSRFRECSYCFPLHAFQHDLFILGWVAVLSAFAFSRKKILAVVARIALVFCGFFYFADIIVFMTFARRRLLFGDIARFSNPMDWFHVALAPEKTSLIGVYLALVLVLVLSLWPSQFKFNRKSSMGFTITGAFLILASMASPRFEHPLADMTRNVFEVNRSRREKLPYTDKFIDNLRRELVVEAKTSQPGLNQKKDVILIILESFSSFQSQFFSGIFDYTPRLDEIARDHRSYRNFLANSYFSKAGRMSLLKGSLSIPYQPGPEPAESLISLFNQFGYQTSAFYACEPRIDDFGPWMKALGIGHFSASDDSYYEKDPRGIFASIPDHRLYERVLSYWHERKSKSPRFAIVVTASTHQPYRDPVHDIPGMQASLRYADDSLYDFYEKLRKERYFDHGLLVITSDHHSMTPVTDAERRRFGEAAGSMIPLILVDSQDSKPIAVDAPFQQADLLNSFEYYLGPSYKSQKWRGNLFTSESSECRVHARSDSLDLEDIFCGSRHGILKLDGDATNFVEGKEILGPEILRQIHLERIQSATGTR